MNKPIDIKDPKFTEKVFESLPPFTITVTDPKQARWLWEIITYYLANGSHEMMKELLTMIGYASRSWGVEQAIEMVMMARFDFHNKQRPAFLKPLLIHIYSHMLSKDVKQ